MLKYIETKNEGICCGCRACEQICPQKAIFMKENNEGFYYPELCSNLCINCGLCESVCPEMKRPIGGKLISIYAVQHKNEEILKNSSSGGVFRLLADEIIINGGCVIGCMWNENYQAILKIAESKSQLEQMQGSKYISSDTGDIYKQVELRLKKGQKVLFTGAPCQCAGLLSFLRQPYNNLLTADFLCHGMPSQKIFDYYLDDIINKHRLATKGKKTLTAIEKERLITSYKFRDKQKKGWGHVSSYTWIQGKKQHKHYNVEMTDPYDCGFLKGYFNRYSCYICPFRGEMRFTDFTFCDYWGVKNFHSEFDTKMGVSALSINTTKADDFRKKLIDKAIWLKTNAIDVAKENPTLLHECTEEIPYMRCKVFSLLEEKGWKATAKKHFRTKNYYLLRIWYSMPTRIVKIIKRVLRVG